MSFPEPHNPYQVPKPYFDMFPPATVPARTVGPEARAGKGFRWQWLRQLEKRTYPGYEQRWRRTRSNYLGMLRLIDDQFNSADAAPGSLRQAREHDRRVPADHGDFFCDYGLERKGVDLPEVLTRIPMVWAGWNIRPQTNLPAFVSTADILPTLVRSHGRADPARLARPQSVAAAAGQTYPGRNSRASTRRLALAA